MITTTYIATSILFE